MAPPNQTIIIKRVKKAKHAHHGGAWKIAYADFVTAMMAFFLLLWLISMTTPEQKEGLANYFAPPNVSPSTSGSGGIMGGSTPNAEGAMAAHAQIDAPPNMASNAQSGADGAAQAQASTQTNPDSSYDPNFQAAAASIRQAWQAMPDIAQIADNLLIEETKDGLNIQIVDQKGRPMFPEGSKYPLEMTRKAIAAIAPILDRLSNRITISGHTAAGAHYDNPRYGAWELSSDRANVVRSILGEFGLSDNHVDAVVGKSTVEPFFPNDPYLAANERIKITVLYDPPAVPAGLHP